MRPIKHAEKGLTLIAGGLFNAIQSVNKYKPNPSFTPKWSDKPLLKSWQKSKPTLGWPRTTDSLCPNCVIEAREAIISGKKDVSVLINEKVGEIKAQIIERDVTAAFGVVEPPVGILFDDSRLVHGGSSESGAKNRSCFKPVHNLPPTPMPS